MGSDSSCCGPNNVPCQQETDSTLLKHNRLNHLAPSNTTEHHYPDNGTNNMEVKSALLPSQPYAPQAPQSLPPNKNININNGKHIHQQQTKKRKKRKYNRLSTQIEILCSDNAKAQSLLLCSKPEKIHRDGTVKEFGFLKYLHTNLSDNTTNELFNKFPSKSNGEYDEHSLSVSQFVSLLTLVVIIYRVKLYQLRTGTQEKPPLSSEKIKTSVEHCAIWCIRSYGVKQNKKEIKVYDDKGNEIKAQYYIYKFRLTQRNFSKNIYKWLKKYVDKEGEIGQGPYHH